MSAKPKFKIGQIVVLEGNPMRVFKVGEKRFFSGTWYYREWLSETWEYEKDLRGLTAFEAGR